LYCIVLYCIVLYCIVANLDVSRWLVKLNGDFLNEGMSV